MTNSKPELIEKIILSLSSLIPSKGWDSTVAIVAENPQLLFQLGTGTLVRIADTFLVVTAAHVVLDAHNYNWTMGISGAQKKFIILGSDWSCSGEGGDPGVLDIAIHKLAQDAVTNLAGKEFINLSDLTTPSNYSTGYYCLFGYPACWTKSADAHTDTLTAGGFQLTTTAYNGDTHLLSNFDPKHHFLLEADDLHLHAYGSDPVFPKRLEGISGCSVWHLGDLSTPIEHWPKNRIGLAGVQTGVYRTNIIKVTRWSSVVNLILQVFPELRPAVQLSVTLQ